MKKIISVIWVVLMILIFAYLEYYGVKEHSGEPGIVEVVCLTLLTFPIGIALPFVWTAIVGLLESTHILQGGADNSIISILMLISYLLVGYWQWFILFPKLIEKFKKWKISRQS